MSALFLCFGQVSAIPLECAHVLPDNVMAFEHVAQGLVAFQPVPAHEDMEIELVHYRPDDGCRPQVVDRYEINGGAPNMAASFMYTVHGEPNLFAIVSWPLMHVGLGMRGQYYEVHAYRQEGHRLTPNTWVSGHPGIRSGVVGTYEGVESTFEGATKEGLILLMTSLGIVP